MRKFDMERSLKLLIWFLSFFLLFNHTTISAQTAGDEEQEVVAKGLGAVIGNDEAKAYDDALSSALRNAVEQVVGTTLRHDGGPVKAVPRASGRHLAAVPREAPAAVGGRQAVEHLEQLRGREGGREQLPRRDVAAKRRRERRLDGPGVQADDDRVAAAPRDLDRGRAHQLVQGGLGRAVAVPAAQAVVGDGPDARGQQRHHAAPRARQQRREVLQHQRRPDRVDREQPRQAGRVEVAQGLLRLQRAVVQDPGSTDHQVRRRITAGLRGARHRRLVQQVDGAVRDPSWRGARRPPRQRGDRADIVTRRQGLDQRAADPAGGADDDRVQWHGR